MLFPFMTLKNSLAKIISIGNFSKLMQDSILKGFKATQLRQETGDVVSSEEIFELSF